MEKMKMQTKDLIQGNIETIKGLFPEVISEGKDSEGNAREVIDFDRLKEILGDDISTSPEHYEFTWVGKREARRLAATPINKTLRPCKEESKDWDSTGNLYIEGDNLDVLKLLQESYLGKVKMIYIDPPYNTGKDFVYKDNFHQSQEDWKEQTTLVDEENNRLAVNPDSSGRFHSDWCTMMYPRLRLAKNLLRDDGVIFISIDDNESHNLRKICDEIFGESNFITNIVVQSNPRGRQADTFVASVYDNLLLYSRNSNEAKIYGMPLTKEQIGEFNQIDVKTEEPFRLLGLRQRGSASKRSDRPDMYFPIYVNPTDQSISLEEKAGWETVLPRKSDGTDGRWMWGKSKCINEIHLLQPKLISHRNEYDIFVKDFLNKKGIERTRKFKTIWDKKEYNNQNGTVEVKALFAAPVMSFPKSKSLLMDICCMGMEKDDVCIDFFSGSATTAHAVMQLNAEDGGNRKFIMVQIPEKCDEKSEAFKDGYSTICEIGKERIRRAGEKIKKEVEQGEVQLELGAEDKKVPDIGFRVLKLDSSNMTDVYFGAAELEQKDLFDSESNIKSDRTELDILFGIMLDWGLPLSLPYKKETFGNTDIHNVEDGALIACFAENISEEVIIAIAKRQATKVVFKDSCFSSSVDRINVEQLFKHYDPTFVSNSDKIRVI